MGIKSGLTPIRPDGSQIEISEEKIVITYLNHKDENRKELAAVEIEPKHLVPFIFQLFEAGEGYEEKFGKTIGFRELADKETSGESDG